MYIEWDTLIKWQTVKRRSRSRLTLLIDNLSRYLFVASVCKKKKENLAPRRMGRKIVWKRFDRERERERERTALESRGILNKVLRCNRAGAMDRL